MSLIKKLTFLKLDNDIFPNIFKYLGIEDVAALFNTCNFIREKFLKIFASRMSIEYYWFTQFRDSLKVKLIENDVALRFSSLVPINIHIDPKSRNAYPEPCSKNIDGALPICVSCPTRYDLEAILSLQFFSSLSDLRFINFRLIPLDKLSPKLKSLRIVGQLNYVTADLPEGLISLELYMPILRIGKIPKNLKHLVIDSMTTCNITKVEFPNLTSLHINKYTNSNECDRYPKNRDLIESI